MSRRWVLAALLVAAATVSGCTGTTVLGQGSTQLQPNAPSQFPSSSTPSSPSTPTAPGGGSSSAAAPTGCPRVDFPAARITFDCITTAMVPGTDPVWPLVVDRTVEKATGWTVDEGAGTVPGDTHALAGLTTSVRTAMVTESGAYGQNPKVTTVRNADTKVGGVPAHVLQSTITLNPAWAAKAGTKVKAEHLWIVALQVDSSEATLWYVSVPDLVSSLWAKVPSVIDSIKVG
jgi:hypothetical protein